ncbi:recombinase family protein [Thermomonospora echinospora]|uniref:recombinase family protein n=1 Tax=Thermomonospora echinospora TaxID=1992 RepID=UPI000CDE9A2F|nr:recombinase family protein [Thermomonospora echinospora]
MRFAFYGRVSTEDNQDPEASRAWQLRRAHALIESRGGQIVAEFFDVDKSRSIPWARRPHASALIEQLKNPGREFDAVVIGEPHRAFYGNQYSLTFPLFEHFGVPLWVPEVGGPIDPANEAHDMIMGVFGGLSKGERNRIKIRVRSAMAAITATEGRYLGGRPPYGYRLADAGPHPNPAKAADGKRLRKLELDPVAAPVVRRIFCEFLGLDGGIEKGLFAIAEGLTRDNIPCPSAHDRARNRHREGAAWCKSAVRAIVTNPRYTGRQVWNKQRKDEVLIDVDDVAMGHTTKLRWNDQDTWIFSEQVVHPPIVDDATFNLVRQRLTARRNQTGGTKARERTKRSYALRGLLYCGLCNRKMQAHTYREYIYFRCRYPEQYALANKVHHPRNIFVREREVTALLDTWLGKTFTPHRLKELIADTQTAPQMDDTALRAKAKIAECHAKLARHRAALEAGADPATIAQWIAETNTELKIAESQAHTPTDRQPALTPEQIDALITACGGLVQALQDAEPQDRQDVYRQLGIRLTYEPRKQEIRVETRIDPDQLTPHDPCHGVTVRVRGGT